MAPEAPDPAKSGTAKSGTAEPRAAEPRTAEELMRSRFEAYRRGDEAWLLRTWHSSTRPKHLDLSDNPNWRGLQIVHTVAGGPCDDAGIVEFRATYLNEDASLGIMHERSRFVRENGQWFYVDGHLITQERPKRIAESTQKPPKAIESQHHD